MDRRCKLVAIFIFATFLFTGCTALKLTGKTVGVVSKAAFGTAKTIGKIAFGTAKITGKGIKTIVNMAEGKHVVKLDKVGNSLYVDALLNRKVKTKLIVDTGCSNTQISSQIAKSLGIKTNKAEGILCQLADGRLVSGKAVNIKEVRIGRAKVFNVKAVVLDGGMGRKDAGLLGMSFLDNFIFRIDTEKKELVLQRRQ